MTSSTDRHADSTQLARQWALLRVLSGTNRSYAVKELADQLKTSKSTIERDLATLETVFHVVEEADGKQTLASVLATCRSHASASPQAPPRIPPPVFR